MKNKRIKKHSWNWEALDGYDNSALIAVCLTQREVMILKGALIPAYWVTRWENLPDTDNDRDLLDAIIAKIDSQLDGNDCEIDSMEFRDNPLDPCEVQYSNDAGVSWITMFRKDVCPVKLPSTTDDVTKIYNDIDTISTNNTTYAGDILNVAPDWEYLDGNSDNALCLAIGFYVDWICDVAIEQIKTGNVEDRKANDWIDDLGFIIATGIIAQIQVLPAAPITLPVIAVGAITWATARILDNIWDGLIGKSYDQFEDEDAKDEVKCWIYNTLRGETPRFDEWEVSLADFVPATDNEVAISDEVGIINGDLDTFINYMILMQEYNTIRDSLPECDCPSNLIIDQLQGPALEYYGARFSHSSGLAFGGQYDTHAVIPGVYNESTQLYTGIASPIGGVGCNIRITLPKNVLVSRIQILWRASRPNGTLAGDRRCAAFVGIPYVDGSRVLDHTWGAGFYGDANIISDIDEIELVVTTPREHVYIHNSIDMNEGSVTIQWVRITCIDYVP